MKESSQPSSCQAARISHRRSQPLPVAQGVVARITTAWPPFRRVVPKGPLDPSYFVAYKTAAVPTVWAGRENPEWCKQEGDLLEQLPFFSNTTVASQLLVSSISVLLAKPFTIFAEFFVFLSKQWCMVELYLHKWNKFTMYLYFSTVFLSSPCILCNTAKGRKKTPLVLRNIPELQLNCTSNNLSVPRRLGKIEAIDLEWHACLCVRCDEYSVSWVIFACHHPSIYF